ncbi:hypothetical protein DYBT9623_01023 [Dyadobacter sp. CECT 9623]|uniref:Uncharacterized protein n=1 Tax=Dyadobacter linearis TaxID=2823330 RepID=A0ABM8ULI2_9BACT|nr:hypothetical protein DYBT9623_01023 [Dyadobacter sp. CECT 9623]
MQTETVFLTFTADQIYRNNIKRYELGGSYLFFVGTFKRCFLFKNGLNAVIFGLITYEFLHEK